MHTCLITHFTRLPSAPFRRLFTPAKCAPALLCRHSGGEKLPGPTHSDTSTYTHQFRRHCEDNLITKAKKKRFINIIPVKDDILSLLTKAFYSKLDKKVIWNPRLRYCSYVQLMHFLIPALWVRRVTGKILSPGKFPAWHEPFRKSFLSSSFVFSLSAFKQRQKISISTLHLSYSWFLFLQNISVRKVKPPNHLHVNCITINVPNFFLLIDMYWCHCCLLWLQHKQLLPRSVLILHDESESVKCFADNS